MNLNFPSPSALLSKFLPDSCRLIFRGWKRGGRNGRVPPGPSDQSPGPHHQGQTQDVQARHQRVQGDSDAQPGKPTEAQLHCWFGEL